MRGARRVTPDIPHGPYAFWTVHLAGVAHIRSDEYVGSWPGRYTTRLELVRRLLRSFPLLALANLAEQLLQASEYCLGRLEGLN